MKSKLIKAGVVTLTACALLMHPETVFFKDQVVEAANQSQAKQVVKLNSSSSISLQSAQLLTQEQGRVLAYSFVITNNGNKEISLSDYWVRLATNSNKIFSTKISEQDKNVKGIAPKTSRVITYYSLVDDKAKLSDFKFDIIQWDFSVANYERRLGTIVYSKEPALTNNKVANIRYGNVSLAATVPQFSLTQDNALAYLQFNYNIENKGNSIVDLSNIQLFIQTDNNEVYPIDMTQIATQALQAKQKKLYSFNVAVPRSIVGKPLNLVIAHKEATSGLYMPAASNRLGAVKDSTLNQASKTKVVYFSGEKVNTFLDAASLERSGNENKIVFEYALRNVGKTAVEYPNLSFTLQTPNGVTYPLSVVKKEAERDKLLPQLREVVNISGSIPSGIDVSKAKLVVRAGAAEKTEGYVLGAYMFKTSQQSGAIGSNFKYGDYSIKLNNILRTATVADDFLIADFEVSNTAAYSKSVPELEGYFLINGVKLNTEVKKANLDSKVTIAPKGKYNFVVYSQIPYTSNIDNISFVLTEKAASGDSVKTIYRFNGNTLSSMKTIEKDTKYTIENTGQKTETKMIKSQIYSGEKENYFYSEFELINKEIRSSVPASLSGYLKDNNGLVIPVSFTQVNQKVDPGGKVLVSAWTKVKKDFKASNYEFVIGQSINPPSENETSSNSIVVRPVKYKLTDEQNTTVKKDLKNIQIAGYELTLDRVNAVLDVSGLYTVNGLKLNFDYSLAKDSSYDYIAGNHKVMIEFVDQGTNKTTYFKQFALGTPKEGEKALDEAVMRSYSVLMEDPEIQEKLNSYEDYVINIYDVFEDAKILIASKELKWFQVN